MWPSMSILSSLNAPWSDQAAALVLHIDCTPVSMSILVDDSRAVDERTCDHANVEPSMEVALDEMDLTNSSSHE